MSRYRAGIPDVGALLLIELDGDEEEVEEQEEIVNGVLTDTGGARLSVADEGKVWNARKGAFPAMGVISPAYLTLDCNVPRRALPEVLEEVSRIAKRRGVFIANVFHAGDGNLHPLIPYDPSSPESLFRAIQASNEIVKEALRVGGVPSGEHGIGIEKVKFMGLYHGEAEMRVMRRIKDSFDPRGLMNPCKLLGGCEPKTEVTRWLWEWD